MDVDNIVPEEAMETDPPPSSALAFDHQDPSIDPDGDAQMDAGDELYDEEGDVEIGEGNAEGEGEGDVDADGDITPVEAEEEGQEYFVEQVAELASQEGSEAEEVAEVDVEGEAEAVVITAPATDEASSEPAQNTADVVEARQAEQGNVAVEPEHPTESSGTTATEEAAEGTQAGQDTEKAGIEEGVEQADHVEDAEEHYGADGDDDDDDEAYYEDEALTYETIPPVQLHLPNATRALFKEYSDSPVWFADKAQTLIEGSISQLWSTIRAEMKAEGLGNDVDEMVITEKETDLVMGDSDVNLQNVTFLELVQLYHDCAVGDTFELHLDFRPHRFITRFDAIKKVLESQEVTELQSGEDEEQEEVEEGAAAEQQDDGDNGKANLAAEQEPEETSPVADTNNAEAAENAETETGQLPIPLPGNSDETRADTGVEVTESDEHVEAAEAQPTTGEETSGPEDAESGQHQTGDSVTHLIAGDATPAEITSHETSTTPPSTIKKTASQVIAEDDALIGTPEIRAADARNPLEATTESLIEIGDAEPDEGAGGSVDRAPAPDHAHSRTEALHGDADGSEEAPQTEGKGDATDAKDNEEHDQHDQDDRKHGQQDSVEEVSAAVADAVDTAEGEHHEQNGEDEVIASEEQPGEAGEEVYNEGDDGEDYEEAEGEDQDPYGVDKYVEGVDADTQEEGLEVYEWYEEEPEDDESAPEDTEESHDPEPDHTNGELHDEVTDETSPAKRSRSDEEGEGASEEVAGKRVKLGEVEVAESGAEAHEEAQ